jgi:hypothetical protein
MALAISSPYFVENETRNMWEITKLNWKTFFWPMGQILVSIYDFLKFSTWFMGYIMLGNLYWCFLLVKTNGNWDGEMFVVIDGLMKYLLNLFSGICDGKDCASFHLFWGDIVLEIPCMTQLLRGGPYNT